MDLLLDVEAVRAAVAGGRALGFRLFFDHAPSADDAVFSQWWPCAFTLDGQRYTTAEQLMMAAKARLFGDDDALARILATDDPGAIKAIGRQVRGFDGAAWGRVSQGVVTRGNVAKFGQDQRLRALLLATGHDILVEAAPNDLVWGIGLARDDPRARDPLAWRGRNLLGFALVRARAILRGELPALTP